MNSLPTTASVPDGDLSAQLLNQLLGPGWDRLAPRTGTEAAAALIHQVLSGFNYLALAAVSLLFVWYLIGAAAGAAQEGTPGGRRYGGFWLPLRMAGALTFTAPVYHGLSLFQAGLLLAVGFSVNVANYVWAQGIDFFADHGGRLTLNAPASVVEDAQELGRGVLKALTVQEYYRQRLDKTVSGFIASEEFWPPAGTAGGQLTVSFRPPPESSLGAGDLGRIRIPCADPAAPLCRARLSAVRSLIADLAEPAVQLADLNVSISSIPADRPARAVLTYQSRIEPHLAADESRAREELTGSLADFKAQAKSNGWLTAGASYWTMTGLNRKSARALYQSVSFSPGQGGALEGEVLSDFDSVMARYDRYIQGAYESGRAVGGRGAAASFPSLEWFNDKISGALGRYGLDKLTAHLAQGDPVTSLASLGHFLLGAAETVIGLKVFSMALTQGSQNSSDSFLGQVISALSGSVSSFLTGLAGGTVTALGPYLTALSLLLLGYGFFLAYFLPALPMIFWLSGVLGWLMVVAESLIAAPLWAAAHALPEGEGLTGQAGKKGYLLFLGVLLRPPLMVTGFLLAMALMNLLGRLGGQMLSVLGEEILKDSFSGVSGFLALAAISGITAVTAAYKLFGLSAHLPDRVAGWLGQESRHLGEPGDAQKAHSHYAAAAAAGTGAVRLAVSPPLSGQPRTETNAGDHL